MIDRPTRQQLGHTGEERAIAYLQQHDYTIVARNWRQRRGEIDIIARDGEWLVFVEVRTRLGDTFGPAEDSVTRRKQARLARLAESFVFQTGWAGRWRIDVLALQFAAGGALVSLHHYRDAVEGTP